MYIKNMWRISLLCSYILNILLLVYGDSTPMGSLETTPGMTYSTEWPTTTENTGITDVQLDQLWIGSVQIKYQGRRMGICSDKWGSKDCAVVCREIGFSGDTMKNTVDPERNQLLLLNVNCNKNDQNLNSCGHGGIGNCSKRYAGCICSPPDIFENYTLKAEGYLCLHDIEAITVANPMQCRQACDEYEDCYTFSYVFGISVNCFLSSDVSTCKSVNILAEDLKGYVYYKDMVTTTVLPVSTEGVSQSSANKTGLAVGITAAVLIIFGIVVFGITVIIFRKRIQKLKENGKTSVTEMRSTSSTHNIGCRDSDVPRYSTASFNEDTYYCIKDDPRVATSQTMSKDESEYVDCIRNKQDSLRGATQSTGVTRSTQDQITSNALVDGPAIVMTENPDYGDDVKPLESAADHVDMDMALAGDMTENVGYNGCSDSFVAGYKECGPQKNLQNQVQDKKQNGNYVYTYGHFSLQGREREPNKE